jgi:murein tripeptide amidase MpaA
LPRFVIYTMPLPPWPTLSQYRASLRRDAEDGQAPIVTYLTPIVTYQGLPEATEERIAVADPRLYQPINRTIVPQLTFPNEDLAIMSHLQLIGPNRVVAMEAAAILALHRGQVSDALFSAQVLAATERQNAADNQELADELEDEVQALTAALTLARARRAATKERFNNERQHRLALEATLNVYKEELAAAEEKNKKLEREVASHRADLPILEAKRQKIKTTKRDDAWDETWERYQAANNEKVYDYESDITVLDDE